MTDDTARLRIAIRKIIAEEGDAGMPGFGADVGPMSMGYGFMNYGGPLKDIFIKPFTDVIDTVKGVATELSARAVAASQVVIESVLSTFIPLYTTNYTAIFRQLNKNLKDIQKKYEAVYKANDEAFRDKDARFMAFLYDPSSWVTTKVAESTPGAVADVLEIFSDSLSGTGTHLLQTIHYLREMQREIRGVSRWNRDVPQRLRNYAQTYSKSYKDVLPFESIKGSQSLQESDKVNRSQEIQRLLSDPALKKEINSSPLAKQMKADAQKMLGGLVNHLGKDINDVNSINSMQDIVKLGHGKIQRPDYGNIPLREKQAAEDVAVTNVKRGLSEFYKKSLQGAIARAESENVAPDNEYLQTLKSLLRKVG